MFFLLEKAVVDTPAKYAGAVVGSFLIAFIAEIIVYIRSRVRRDFKAKAGTVSGTAWPVCLMSVCLRLICSTGMMTVGLMVLALLLLWC